MLVENGLTFNDQQAPTDYDILRFSETCLVLSYISPDISSKQLTQVDTNSQHGSKKPSESSSRKRGKENQQNETITDKRDQQQPKLMFYTEPFKLENEETPFDRLTEAIVGQFNNMSTIYWVPMAESAVQCVFKLADRPIEIIELMVIRLMDKIPVLKSLMNGAASDSGDDQFVLSYDLMTRFVNLMGIIATKLLVFMNQMVVCELKRRKMCKESKSNIVS